MAWNAVCRVSALNKRRPAAFSSLSSGLTAEHDQQNRRFTVRPDSGAGAPDCAVLRYRFTGDKEVDLMSTFVPETFRGRGVAALLSQAAMDFVVEEKLRARVSCWYIKKYIEEDPLQRYKDVVISYLSSTDSTSGNNLQQHVQE